MSTEHKELAIRALQGLKGDDTYRARRAFQGMSAADMSQEHGQSGRTRAEILAEYESYDAKVDAAIAWLNEIAR